MIEIDLPMQMSPVRELLTRLAPLLDFEHGPWVAGGFIRRMLSEKTNDAYDIDVFFRDAYQRNQIAPRLREIEYQFRSENGCAQSQDILEMKARNVPVNIDGKTQMECVNAETRGMAFRRDHILPPLQFVTEYEYPTMHALLADIDFTICQMATDGRTIRCSQQSLDDFHNRQLVISGTSKIRATTRIFRYFSYGYEPNPDVMEIAKTLGGEGLRYYDPEGPVGFTGYDSAVERLMSRNLSESILLSRIGDIFVERDDGFATAFLHGAPFPAPMAFLWMAVPQMALNIAKKLQPLWNKWNVSAPTSCQKISLERFFDVYRQAFADSI